MLTDEGNIRLIDFNISHKADRSKAKDTVVMGTDGYAAPEQFGFARSDERTDIYAIGVLFNYMLTGNREVGGYSDNKRYADIIDRCTRFEPDKRYRQCSEIKEALKSDKCVSIDNSDRLSRVKRITKAVCRVLLVIAIFTELIFLAYILKELLLNGHTDNLGILADWTIMCILPFPIIGNWLNWQSHTKLNALSAPVRTAVSVGIYAIIFIVYAVKV
jgi:serine/threonine protein kinase